MPNPSFQRLLARLEVALTVALALFAAATALILAAVNPALDGQLIAKLTVLVIGVIGVGVTVAAMILRRLGLPDNNDDWVYW